jgi:lambda family phage portal protein
MAIPLWLRKMFGKGEASAPATRRSDVVRMKVGATSGPYWHDGSKFRGGLPNSGTSPILDHQYLRYNAREQWHVTPIARAMIERFAETVVDDGLHLEPAPAASVLGLSAEQAEQWSASVAQRFHLWAGSKFATRSEQMTFYQAQRFVELAQHRDGEYFVRFHYDDDPKRPSTLSVSFVEPDQIVGCAYTASQGYPYDYGDGINRDAAGREVSYEVSVRRGSAWTTETIPAVLPSGRRMMLHGWCPEYASQTRGFSRLAHAIQEFEQLTGFTSAQINKAIMQSIFVMAKETDASAVPTQSIFGDAAAQYASENTDTEVAPAVPEFGFDPMRIKLSPGGIFVADGLGAGEKLKGFENTAPSDSFASFTDAFVAHLSASVSMPVEVLMLRFNSNYSASRAALVMFWRVAVMWRRELESDFLGPVWETWLAEEIAAGRISARGWLDPILRSAWLCAEWVGSQMPVIDPKVSAEAARALIEAGLSTAEREAREINGSDANQNKVRNLAFFDGMGPAPWNKQAPLVPPTEKGATK